LRPYWPTTSSTTRASRRRCRWRSRCIRPGAAGHLRWALLIAGLFVAGAIAFLVFVSQEPVLSVLGVLVDEATLWLAILLFGDAVHSRRVLAHQQRLLEAERAR
jgi:hypothetical protein